MIFAEFWIMSAISHRINCTALGTSLFRLIALSISQYRLNLIHILVSIAFNNKWFEEFSFCSISMFNRINDVCDWIYHNLISHADLLVRIHLLHLQHRSSFDSVFRWKWLNVARKQSSRWWIACNFCCCISWICI